MSNDATDATPRIIINAVLAYTVYAKSRSTRDNLITVLDATYTENEISDARDELWKAGGVDLLGECPGRKDSATRTRRHVLCCDVYDAMRKLDAADADFPTFVADPVGIGRLPRYNPEDLNVVAMDQRIRELERLHNTLDARVTLKASRQDTMDDDLNIVKLAVDQHTNRFRSMDASKRQPPKCVTVSTSSAGGPITTPIDTSPVSDSNGSNSAPVPPICAPGSTPDIRHPGPMLPEVGRDPANITSYSNLAGDLQSNPGGIDSAPPFKTIQRKRRVKVVTGSSTSGNRFKAGPRTRNVFLYRVCCTVTEDHIKDHMTGKDIKFNSIKTMSNPEAMTKSFLITVLSDDYSNALNSDNWPSGTKLREFRMPPGGLRNNNGTKFS